MAKKWLEDWGTEFANTLEQIYSLSLSGKLSSVTMTAIGQIVRRHARYSNGKIKEFATLILEHIETSVHTRTIAALINGWSVVWEMSDHKAAEAEYGKRIDALIERLYSIHKTDKKLLEYIKQSLIEISAAEIPSNEFRPDMLIGRIQDKSNTFSWLLLKDAYDDTSSPIYDHAGQALAILLSKKHKDAENMRNALSNDEDRLRKGIIASAYARYYPEKYTDEDIYSLSQVLKSKVKNILSKIEKIKEIADYHITKFLRYVAHKFTQITIEYFHRRVESSLAGEDPYFRVIDLELDRAKSLELYQHPEARKWFFYSLDWATGLIGKDFFKHIFGKMMQIFYYPFPYPMTQDLLLWLGSGDKKRFAVIAYLLRVLPENFVFDNQDFVQAIMQKAQEYGEKEVEQASRGLCQTLEKVSWIDGEDSGQQQIIEKAKAIVEEIGCFSPASALYASIIEKAERLLVCRQEWDEEDFD
ncbi:hypothetical protein KL86DPRO_70058 [uncultured delta proteobacterium]|uniref:Uncharacterized protein n=1 Tax=uncultured delta proteobacterium TaxID=34034 RepID=A0A212KGJ6_9DELT|nr:hypothetical protein KL86DPRO_70058 [uncultured delta proteobacterium]